jgi:NTE family protein
MAETKIAIACQGGGSHTAFTAGVLKKFFQEGIDKQYDIVGLSGTSGGGLCATSCWYGLLKKAQGSREPVSKFMLELWQGNSAQSLWEWLFNFGAINTIELQDRGVIPSFAASPYDTKWLLNIWMAIAPRKEFLDFKQLLEQNINFAEIDSLVTQSSPRLLLGAVEILSGEFKAFDSHKGEITVEAVMASAAIPNIFEAVRIGAGAYWDGLFSQNPPVSEFLVEDVGQRPDEIWIVQINPKNREEVPKKARDIIDRRNELAGNLSLFQEVRFIELVNLGGRRLF